MSDQISIPAVYMRGGTSKGLLFNKHYLPNDQSELDKYLLAAMGSPDLRQINGMGGATSVTSKVCIISKSTQENVDIDYLFAQVIIDKAKVDYGPVIYFCFVYNYLSKQVIYIYIFLCAF